MEIFDYFSKKEINQLLLDILSIESHKEYGNKELDAARWIYDFFEKENINVKEETMAFGDGGNDIEMLEHVNYSFAMENGSEEVRNTAKYVAPSNNHSGVLEIIDRYFANQDPFKF